MNAYRLLVISADTEMSQMLETYFVGLGYDIQLVSGLDEAIGVIKTYQPNLILFDSKLPYSQLSSEKPRMHTVASSIPIIWIVSFEDRPDKITSLELEGDDFMSKPFDIEEVNLRVRNIIRAIERTTQKRP
jgi:DNA-binding response OmpR family regulator